MKTALKKFLNSKLSREEQKKILGGADEDKPWKPTSKCPAGFPCQQAWLCYATDLVGNPVHGGFVFSENAAAAWVEQWGNQLGGIAYCVPRGL